MNDTIPELASRVGRPVSSVAFLVHPIIWHLSPRPQPAERPGDDMMRKVTTLTSPNGAICVLLFFLKSLGTPFMYLHERSKLTDTALVVSGWLPQTVD